MNDICFVVTSWEDSLFLSIKQTLLSMSVPEQNIYRISDRTSRPAALNAMWDKLSIPKYKYIAFIDEDVVIRDNHTFARLREILENTEAAGVIANPKLISEGQSFYDIKHDLPPETPWKDSLVECTSNLVSLNCALFRNDLEIGFDEDMFGNQVFDLDFGLQLALQGKKVFIDKALLVLARANNYVSKSLSYHAVVARNLHIFMRKWSNIKDWDKECGVKAYNTKHNNEIPSIEELMHWPEIKQLQYTFAYNRDGAVRCYLQPRFSGLIQAASLVQNIENNLKNIPNMVEYAIPHQGSLPIFDLK